MPTPLVKPTTVPLPFAASGTKNAIPTAASPTPGLASLVEGFPPETMTPITSGGVPPSGDDFNGILNLITQHVAWVNAGGQYTFDAGLSTYVGGYSIGMVVQSDDGASSYVSLANNNTTNFNSTPASIGTLWAPYAGQAVRNSSTSVATTGGSTTLSSLQYSARFITVTGVLASNATLVFPTALGRWTVINNTTGSFSLTCKTAAGTGVTVTQSAADDVICDAVNIVYSQTDVGTRPAHDSSVAAASTAYVDRAVSNIGGYYQDTGVVTNAYVIVTTPATTVYTQGDTWRVRTTRTNSGAATFNAGPGAIPLLRENGTPVQAGDIGSSIFTATYDSGNAILSEVVVSQLGTLALLNIGAFLFNDGAGNLAAVDQSSAILYQLGLAF